MARINYERTGVPYQARQLKLDPCEIRRRNFVRPEAMPWKTPTGQKYDCGEFERNMVRWDFGPEGGSLSNEGEEPVEALEGEGEES